MKILKRSHQLGHHARSSVIAFQEVTMSRWQSFVSSLELEKRIDFEVGDLGLAGADEFPKINLH